MPDLGFNVYRTVRSVYRTVRSATQCRTGRSPPPDLETCRKPRWGKPRWSEEVELIMFAGLVYPFSKGCIG